MGNCELGAVFNRYGPVNEQEHYVVPRAGLVETLVEQIVRGHYFTIFAPRQMGKTTLLRQLDTIFQQEQGFVSVGLDFEGFERLSVLEFLEAFYLDFGEVLLLNLETHSHPKRTEIQTILADGPPTNFFRLRRSLGAIYRQVADLKIVLIIDEFDAIPQEALTDFLQTLRAIYLTGEKRRSIHSIALIGIQNIASMNLGRSSPFNIARQVALPNFTSGQVHDLLDLYTKETEQSFELGVIGELYRQTNGHPFLVNAVAGKLAEEVALDRSKPITFQELTLAVHRLTKENNYNFETLLRHAETYREQILQLLFGTRHKFTPNLPWVQTTYMYGIIQESSDGFCEIANPIYEQILSDYFKSPQADLQAKILSNAFKKPL